MASKILLPGFNVKDLAVIPWYPSDECYEQFRNTALDPDRFFSTYANWRRAALEHESRTLSNGFEMIRSRVAYSEFEIWIGINGKGNDHQSRSEFAYYRLQSLFERPSNH